MTRPLIFVSYSHKNEREQQQLVTQLRVLESEGQIDLWSDQRIGAGRDWRFEIDAALSAARVGVLLVTAEYLTSGFIREAEVPRLLDAHVSRGLTVFPIVAKPCAWEAVAWLRRLQLRPRDGKPVWRNGGRYAEKELAAIVNELAGVLRTETVPPSTGSIMPSLMDGAGFRGRFADLPCSAECRNAITEVESAAMLLYGRRTFEAAAQLLKLAIEYGVPLYNNHHIGDCAHIYATAAMLLEAAILRPGAGMPEAEEQAEHPLLLSHLMSLAASAGELKSANADDVAWLLRYSFDEILHIDRALARLRNDLERIDRAVGARAEAAVGTALSTVIDAVSGAEQEGVMRGRDWVSTSAAIYRYATDMILQAARWIASQRITEVAHVLKAAGAEAQTAADNPYRVAWRLQHAFANISRTLTSV